MASANCEYYKIKAFCNVIHEKIVQIHKLVKCLGILKIHQCSKVFHKTKPTVHGIIPWKMGSGPGSPFGLESDKAPPEPPGCLIFGGFTDSPHPLKQETRGLDTIQATSFFPWWLLYFSGKGRFVKNPEIRKNPEKSQDCFKANNNEPPCQNLGRISWSCLVDKIAY